MLKVSERTHRRRVKEGYRVSNISHVEAVINCFKAHKGNYGRIRIRKALMREGIVISESTIADILKSNGLVAKMGRVRKKSRYKKTKDEYVADNVVKDKFAVKEKNKLWCADISEIRYRQGKLFASAIIDVATRKIVGLKVDRKQRQGIVQDAIEIANGRYQPEDGLVFHSDRGSQYTATETKKQLEKYKMVSSMSRPGTPHDNQPIESFWKTLKQEIGSLKDFCFEKAKLEIVKYTEIYYNNERLHSSLGYQTPNEAWGAGT